MVDKQFEFLNESDSLTFVLKQILDFIKYALPESTGNETVLFKAKIILTELITNSLKHSGSKSTLFNINIAGNHLTITKTDKGKPLSLIEKTNETPHKVPISNDILHTLYAKSHLKDQVHFMCEENNLADVTAIDDIVEHFGLLIITKAAHKFYYVYDDETRTNTFIVTLEYF